MLSAGVIFGLNHIIAKDLMTGEMTGLVVSSMRVIFGFVAYWITSLFVANDRVSTKDKWILMVGGVFGMFLNQTFFIVGLSMTNSLDAAIIATLPPLIIIVLAAIFLKEPITWKKLLGVILGAIGAVMIAFSSQGYDLASLGSGETMGNVYCVLSCLAYSIYLIIARPVVQRYNTISVLKYLSLGAVPFAFFIGFDNLLEVDFAALGADSWLRLGYVLILATYGANILIPYGLKRLRPTTVSTYNYVQPIVATIATLILGTSVMTLDKAVAAVLVFIGVYLVTKSRSRADILKEKETESLEKEG